MIASCSTQRGSLVKRPFIARSWWTRRADSTTPLASGRRANPRPSRSSPLASPRQRALGVMNDKLFTIRFKLSTGWVAMTAWEGHFDGSHTHLDCELRQNGKTIFPRGATWGDTPGHMTIDG